MSGTTIFLTLQARVDIVSTPAVPEDDPSSILVAFNSDTYSGQQGDVLTGSIALSRTNHLNDVSLAITGLPANATVTLTPAGMSGAVQSAALEITLAANAAIGTAGITVTATSVGVADATDTANVVVTAAGASGITVQVSPGVVTGFRDTSRTVAILLTRTGGYAGTVTPVITGLPTGVTVASYSPTTFAGSVAAVTATLTYATDAAFVALDEATVTCSGAGVGDAVTTFQVTVQDQSTVAPVFFWPGDSAQLVDVAPGSWTSARDNSQGNFHTQLANNPDRSKIVHKNDALVPVAARAGANSEYLIWQNFLGRAMGLRNSLPSIPFDIGGPATHKAIWGHMRVWIPDNYEHRFNVNAAGRGIGSNNKWMTIYGDDYGGESPSSLNQTEPSSGDLDGFMMSINARIARRTATGNVTVMEQTRPNQGGRKVWMGPDGPAYKGAWNVFRFMQKLETTRFVSGDGEARAWCNGTLMHEFLNLQTGAGSYNMGEDPTDPTTAVVPAPGFVRGYLFGAANSGFDVDTIFLLDEFEIYTSDPGW